MAGLIGGLINAAQALGAQQAGVEVAGRNLANVNTPGYSRQRVLLGDRVVVDSPFGPLGTGVEALGIQQVRDRFLDVVVTREISQTASLQAQQSALSQAEANLGEQIDSTGNATSIGDTSASGTGISSAVSNFFNAFSNVAANPADAGAKQVLLQKADMLASKFNVTDQRLSTLQSDLTSQMSGDVTTVNSLLKQIGNLNGQIAASELGAPGSALELRDQRQGQLEALAKYMDFSTKTVPGENGQIQVLAKDAGGSDVLLVQKTAVLGGVSFDGVQFSGGAPAAVLGLQGGSLKGNLDARDGTIQQLRDNLKKTATQIATAVNGAYSATGANFFQTPPASGLLAVDPALNITTFKTSTTGDAGANDVALAVADVAKTKFFTGSGDVINGTISDYFTNTVSGFGGSLAGVNSKLSDQQTVESMLTKQRDSVSSVSMDEEMTNLLKFQRAYQASARVVSVIDQMLDGLVNNMIR